jgi:hypothetical protein
MPRQKTTIVRPPSATALLNAAIDETKHCKTLQEALDLLYRHNELHPESMSAMWYRLNAGRKNQESKLANRLPKVVAQKQRAKDIHDAIVAWRICTSERILQEIKKNDPKTILTIETDKTVLLQTLAELLADRAKKLKKER